MPLIHGPDGAKLSKRHGALGVDAYRAMGYLPAALRNYLVRLGWSHGDAEIMSTEEMIEWFDLDAIGRSAARFDFAKLENLNGHYLRVTPDEEIVDALKALVPELPDGAALGARIGDDGWQQTGARHARIEGARQDSGRAARQCRLSLRHAPAANSMRRRAGFWTKAAGRRLRRSLPRLEAVEPWTQEALEAAVRQFADETGCKLGKVAQPLRAALTGRSTSPGIFDVLDVLGREESLARIRDQVHAGKSA